MKIITYNINGIRAATKKGFLEWLAQEQPSVVCLQEVKALAEQAPLAELNNLGYHVYWHPAERKGYSGVATLSKQKPHTVTEGMGIPLYDVEGRVLRIDFDNFAIINTYFPSGSSGDERQSYKYQFLEDYLPYLAGIKQEQPNIIVCGDVNICHRPIDIHNPQRNQNTSGFLLEERAWMDRFMESGFVDAFRQFNASPHHYSWWSYRANARQKNLGWRIDYFWVSEGLSAQLKSCDILADVVHSDHCPVRLEMF